MITEQQAKELFKTAPFGGFHKLTHSYPETCGIDNRGYRHPEGSKTPWYRWLRTEQRRINNSDRIAFIAKREKNGEILYSLWVDCSFKAVPEVAKKEKVS